MPPFTHTPLLASNILRTFEPQTLPAMSYLLLIVEPEGQRQTRSAAEGRAVFDRMVRWGEGLKAQGKLAASESLQSPGPDTAHVKVRNGRPQVLDGPFAEAKEFVGGFFLLTVPTRDEAVAIAASCPAAEWATVEVRAVAPCYE